MFLQFTLRVELREFNQLEREIKESFLLKNFAIPYMTIQKLYPWSFLQN